RGSDVRLAILLLAVGLPLVAVAEPPEPDVFFVAVGNSYYRHIAPSGHRDPKAREFGDVPGAGRSARYVAELLAGRGARGGVLLVSDVDRFVTRADVDHALARVLARAATSP